MESVYKHLVRLQDELILLFTPPFQRTARDPGYIKGYPRGIRENGGQYTHAALWAIWAFAQMGQGDRATRNRFRDEFETPRGQGEFRRQAADRYSSRRTRPPCPPARLAGTGHEVSR